MNIRLSAVRAARAALVASAALLCPNPAGAHDHTVLRGRLVFANHEKPVVRILDLDSGEVTHGFDLPKANPTFAQAEDGRHVLIKTGDDAGAVRILDSGIVRESHGDHDDVEKLTPRLLDLVLTGDKPAHVVSRNGKIALFYDGERPWTRKSDPKAVLLDLKGLGRQAQGRDAEEPGAAARHRGAARRAARPDVNPERGLREGRG